MKKKTISGWLDASAVNGLLWWIFMLHPLARRHGHDLAKYTIRWARGERDTEGGGLMKAQKYANACYVPWSISCVNYGPGTYYCSGSENSSGTRTKRGEPVAKSSTKKKKRQRALFSSRSRWISRRGSGLTFSDSNTPDLMWDFFCFTARTKLCWLFIRDLESRWKTKMNLEHRIRLFFFFI